MSCCTGRRGFYGGYGTTVTTYEQEIASGLSPEMARFVVAQQEAGFREINKLVNPSPPGLITGSKQENGWVLGGLAVLAGLWAVTR